MADINLTALGMSGSGKTCFLLAMYYEMSAGVKGYTLSVQNADDDVELRGKWKRLCELQGQSRFPQGTDKNGDYQFSLEYAYQTIKSFHWMDYRGGSLETQGIQTDDPTEYEELLARIKDSTCLFIFVDGAHLAGSDDKEVMIKKVRDNCSSAINQHISKYKDENKKLPPIAIVITKYDKCLNLDRNILFEIVKEAFSPLFTVDESVNQVAIIPVSIGKNIDDENYTGSLNPINICKPLFFGIFNPLKRELCEYKEKQKDLYKELTREEKTLEEKTDILNTRYDGKHVLRNTLKRSGKKTLLSSINESKEKIRVLTEQVTEIDSNVEQYAKYVEKIWSELIGLTVFKKGKMYEIVEGMNYDE